MALSGASYLVLGAAGGIGAATCRRLREAGANMLLAGRSEANLSPLATELGCEALVVDATQTEAVEAAAQQVLESFGRIDGVVNAVGSLLLKPAHLTTDQEWADTLAANLTTAFAAVRAAAKTMRRPGPAGVSGGSVVLISSAAGRAGFASHEAIAAAKAGVIGLARSAAASYASVGIRVNAVAPGLVRTPLTERIWGTPTAAAASEELHAAGRLGEPDDVAAMIVWLLDPANSWVTGQVIGVDGGLANVRPPTRRR
ncbi:SDR family NAD(P)-dependent oxidoreductase [Botrimarina hoheduenensis]|uniref:3-oxoacyl-[acyl-carrier-protein] reductase FabG n=1 Tax=Botrimarina hoheduenensis TaxID=2528000 RepID=A0A5C5WE85_9BACT|nr:SDR family oxidoreductase [Botrimarina hoheduenensis]TWT48787.1 3-oxoacyl-[acyl-carrier-protein] reductase FabG [Botrimarina hoheduenensis]